MSERKPPKTEDNRATGKLSLADLIAQTPGAQPREQLIERINARQQKPSKGQANPAPAEEELVTPEPLPFVNQSARFAAKFRALLEEKTKAKPTTKRSKPRLVVNNDKPEPSEKK